MMKGFLGLIIIFFISSAVLIGPVAAATFGTTAISGNPKVAVSIVLNQSAIFLDLDPAVAQPVTNNTFAVIVSTNCPFTVTVGDNTVGRDPGDHGYMGNYTTSYVAYPRNTTLALPLDLVGTTNSSTSAAALVPPIRATPQQLYSGGSKVNLQYLMPNEFRQTVSYDDPRLPDPSVYRIDLIFTIGAT